MRVYSETAFHFFIESNYLQMYLGTSENPFDKAVKCGLFPSSHYGSAFPSSVITCLTSPGDSAHTTLSLVASTQAVLSYMPLRPVKGQLQPPHLSPALLCYHICVTIMER